MVLPPLSTELGSFSTSYWVPFAFSDRATAATGGQQPSRRHSESIHVDESGAIPNQPYALHGFRKSRRNLLSSYQIAKPTASIRPEATMRTKRIGRKSSGVIVIHLSVPNGN